jgi:hypothetical protein
MIFSALHIILASIFITVLDWNIFFFLWTFLLLLSDSHFSRFGRFSLILKWDNLYFHCSQDLLADNIVFNVSCKFIRTIVMQTSIILYNILATLCKLYHMHCLSLAPSFLRSLLCLYISMDWTIKKSKKAINQGYKSRFSTSGILQHFYWWISREKCLWKQISHKLQKLLQKAQDMLKTCNILQGWPM